MYRHILFSGILCASLVAVVTPSRAGSLPKSPAIQRKAARIFQAVQSEARQARDHADNLESFRTPGEPSWNVVAAQLNDLRAEVNDMAGRLQRLERLRSRATRRQQAEIDHLSTRAQLLANYTADAITFADNNQHDLWNLTYRRYIADADHDARMLERTADHAVERAKLDREGRQSGNVRTAS